MKIIIITQNDPFYVAKSIKYLISILPKDVSIVGCVVNSPSPFGKKESFLEKTYKTYRIFGTKFFLYYSLKYLRSKFSRENNLLHVLNSNKIRIITLKSNINTKESVGIIKYYNPDLLVSILGNQIFKEPIINLAPKGCINLHTALLPKYRGLLPTFWVLKNEEEETGVSVFFVDKGIDSGPIIVQKRIKIGNMTQEQLINVTKKIGIESISEAIDLIKNDKVNLIPNPKEFMTYYSFPNREDVKDFIKKGKKFF